MRSSKRRRPFYTGWAVTFVMGCTPEAETPEPPPAELPAPAESAFGSAPAVTRFLTQATFGPRPADVEALRGTSASAWFRNQLTISPSLLTPRVLRERARLGTPDEDGEAFGESVTLAFWNNTCRGPDQLRQRMAFALSQIFVVSNAPTELLADIPDALSHYQDLLITGAFGNFHDLLTEVSYSPAMAYYLTYLGSEKADPATGRRPDENYARELMQLFTLGVEEIGLDGSSQPREGRTETYDNRDVTGLAKVFTGLGLVNPVPDEPWGAYPDSFRARLVFDASKHSSAAKSFLGTTIPAHTPGPESLRMALDAIFAHPNVAPFISRQLIQRFVTSAPSPAYVSRVAQAFERGQYDLPDGVGVGTGRRGDLAATLAATLFDTEARASAPAPSFGKVREPILRLTAWVRAFDVSGITPLYILPLYDTSRPQRLNQHPYRAPSVFNFFRPGYVASGTLSGQAGRTAPELQIVNASTIPAYANFIHEFIVRNPESLGEGEREDLADRGLDLVAAQNSFLPDYTSELAFAANPPALVEHLDGKLTYGTMSRTTHERIVRALELVPAGEAERRVHVAVWMTMTTPEFLVQR